MARCCLRAALLLLLLLLLLFVEEEEDLLVVVVVVVRATGVSVALLNLETLATYLPLCADILSLSEEQSFHTNVFLKLVLKRK